VLGQWLPGVTSTFERRPFTAAAEPVRLTLDQFPRPRKVDQLANLFPPQAARPADRAPAVPPELSDLLGAARRRVARLVASVVLPPQVGISVTEVTIGVGGRGVRVVYTAPVPLPPEAEAMSREQGVRALDLPGVGRRGAARPTTKGGQTEDLLLRMLPYRPWESLRRHVGTYG
jgi:hypothetical protein